MTPTSLDTWAYSRNNRNTDATFVVAQGVKGTMTSIKQSIFTTAVAIATIMAPTFASAAQLSSDAKSATPKEIQQLIVVDYRAMQNSPAAMDLKDRVLPPELKRLETALKSSGLKVDQDADVLAFAAFRDQKGDGTRIVGIAQGQFHTREVLANFTKNKV